MGWLTMAAATSDIPMVATGMQGGPGATQEPREPGEPKPVTTAPAAAPAQPGVSEVCLLPLLRVAPVNALTA